MPTFAGIGSRETPSDVLDLMEKIGAWLAQNDTILRSGGAFGADRSFAKGYLTIRKDPEIFYARDATPEALELTSKYCPWWDNCDEYARALHGRNAMIVLGRNLDNPVDFVICWTKDGKASGGTGQALRIAQDHKIMVYNLQHPKVRDYFEKALK